MICRTIAWRVRGKYTAQGTREPASRRRVPTFEGLESRWVPSGGTTATAAGAASSDYGVDSLATGDFNGDRLVDIAVAGRQSGNVVVGIYGGGGMADSRSPTGTVVNPLLAQPLLNPLGPGTGPLSIAAGDFTGRGLTELAIASTAYGNNAKPIVEIWIPSLADPNASPLDAQIVLKELAAFVPQGMDGATGLELAAANFNGSATDQLVVAPAGGTAHALDILQYAPTSGTFSVNEHFALDRLGFPAGVSVAAGALNAVAAGSASASSTPVIAVGSLTGGEVKVLSASGGTVEHTLHPLATKSNKKLIEPKGVRVAIVSNEGPAGALVVTPLTPDSTLPTAAVISPKNWKAQHFTPALSPGGGGLVPFGGGWVYPRSSINDPSNPLPMSQGPVTPTLLMASTETHYVLVQQFRGQPTRLRPSANVNDAFLEPMLASATAEAPFTPIEIRGDMPGMDSAYKTPAIVYPTSISYQSPYRIDLTGEPSSAFAGLPGTGAVSGSNNKGWGPANPTINPPTVPAGLSPAQTTNWLQARLLAAYSQAIGVAYQHHHNPFWQPVQGQPWNAVTLGYQSQGVDCTNLTAYAYNAALGIWLTGDTKSQAAITSPTSVTNNKPDINVPKPMLPYVHVQTILVPNNSLAEYNHLVKDVLQPGDILYIAPKRVTGSPSDPQDCAHAITWLGSFGTDTNSIDKHLIVDSTGNAPLHVDSSNHVIAPGVEIRPFEYGPLGSAQGWYFNHIDHILRIIITPPGAGVDSGASAR